MIHSTIDSPRYVTNETTVDLPENFLFAPVEGKDDSQSASILPLAFEPTPYTVIVGRGKAQKQNLGNKHLRILATGLLPQYSEAKDKRTKTRVVNSIVTTIRNANGLFVKRGKDDGRWYQVDDGVAREKVGYVFRDLLADRYRSSSKSKTARRHKEQVGRATKTLGRAMRQTHSCEAPPRMLPATLFSSDEPVPTTMDLFPNVLIGGSRTSHRPIGDNGDQNKLMESARTIITGEGENTINEAIELEDVIGSGQDHYELNAFMDSLLFSPVECSRQIGK